MSELYDLFHAGVNPDLPVIRPAVSPCRSDSPAHPTASRPAPGARDLLDQLWRFDELDDGRELIAGCALT